MESGPSLKFSSIDTHVGGYDDLYAIDRSGDLEKLLS